MAVAQIAQYLGFQSTMTDSFLLFSSIFGFHAKKQTCTSKEHVLH